MKIWNGSAMIKPNLFIIGAAKCGTTSLYEYLKQHPEVYFPDGDQIRKLRPDLARKNIKEPKYFSSRYHTYPHLGRGDILTVDRKVVRDLKDYLYLFSFAGDRPVVAEASTDTIFHPRTAEDIHAFNPESRIIILLRDPIRRAHSAYMHLAGEGREKLDFFSALQEEGNRINHDHIWYYVKGSLYHDAVSHFLEVFGRDRVKIIIFEEFVRAPGKFLEDLCCFLGIDPGFVFDTDSVYNKSGLYRNKLLARFVGRPSLLKQLVKKLLGNSPLEKAIRKNLQGKKGKLPLEENARAYLQERLREDTDRLRDLLGDALSRWEI